MQADTLRLGVIGAGTVTSGSHLPVLVNMPEVRVAWVCDRNLAAAQAVARAYRIADAFAGVDECPDVDVALVATPIGSRRTLLPEVLARGWHAFCEKPFAFTLAEHDAYLEAAARHGVRVGVGQQRRFAAPTATARRLLERGALGPLLRVSAAQGARVRSTGRGAEWHLTSREAGGGVLMESGTHLVDQVLYTLDARAVALRECTQRTVRGLELATSLVADVTLPSGRSVECAIEVSALDDLCNGVFLEFASCVLRVGLTFGDPLALVTRDGAAICALQPNEGTDDAIRGFCLEWRDFLEECRTGAPSRVAAASVRHTTALIEACYARASVAPAAAAGAAVPAAAPRAASPLVAREGRVRRVGVAGATGQVGAAVVRRLHDEGWPVVAVTRNAVGAALVDAAVPGCEVRVGSLTAEAGRPHLLDDCDVIVNCALAAPGGDPRLAYELNERLVDGLLGARSLRWLVHFSTVAIYGDLIRAASDEARAFRRPHPTSEYGRSKLHVERFLARRAAARGVAHTVIRLGHVYGAGIPRSRELIEFALDPRFGLPFDGRHRSNAVHVDRIAAAVQALLETDGAPPALCNLAESEHTWRDVFDWHTGSVGLPPVPAMSEEASRSGRAAYARRSVARDVAAWARGLPVRGLVRSPAVFDVALRVLTKTPASVTRRVTEANRRLGARSLVASVVSPAGPLVGPRYYSDAIPGPHLPLPSLDAAARGGAAGAARALHDWHLGWSRPRVAVRAAAGPAPAGPAPAAVPAPPAVAAPA